jgi:hypothetical protein
VRLTLVTNGAETFAAEISQDLYRALGITVGGRFFVTPKELRVFPGD